MKPIIHYLKISDQLSANRVDHFIANSEFIRKRIEKCYRRPATVIHPPVDIDDFSPCESKQDYYLYLGQLVAYKQPQLVVDAFNQSGKPLKMVGAGEMEQTLKQQANSNIEILGPQSFDNIKHLLSEAKALIFPGVEDFGIVPIEALASGTPVIAYAKGGALETVKEGVTGLFFREQTSESLNDAVNRFETSPKLSQQNLMQEAKQFSKAQFTKNIKLFIKNKANL